MCSGVVLRDCCSVNPRPWPLAVRLMWPDGDAEDANEGRDLG